MEPTSSSAPKSRFRTIVHRIAAWLWLIVIAAILYNSYFTHLGIVGLVGPDEPRYASIARDMAESGDFITPRLYGQPWFEKPPLYYWSAAASFKLFGISEIAARLPSAIYALLATLAMAGLAWRLYDAETARWLLLLLPTSTAMIGFSHAAATDMPFAATLTLAMICAAILLGLPPQQNSQAVVSGDAPRLLPSVFFGFFLGLAVLAKGPAALILIGGAAVIWAAITKRWRDTLSLLHPAAIAAFCITALPWYFLCAARNPDFLRVFIIEHNFKRFLTPEFQHVQPFWFYAGILLIAFLPWTIPFLWSLFTGLHRIRRGSLSPSTSFLLCWSTFCVVFFTISRSKLPGYILPAIPPIALLVARSCTRLTDTKPRRWSLALLCLAFAISTAIAFFVMASHSDRLLKTAVAFWPAFALALLLIALSNFLLGFFLLFGRRSAALIAAAIPFLPALWLFGQIDQFTPLSIVSPRYIANQIAAEQIPLSQLRISKLRRATLYGVNFYLRADLQEWDHDPSKEVFLLTDGLHCRMKPAAMRCEDLWIEQERLDAFDVLHLTPER